MREIYIRIPRELTSYEFYNSVLDRVDSLMVSEENTVILDFSETCRVEPLVIPNLLCLGYHIKSKYAKTAGIFIPDIVYTGKIKKYFREIGFTDLVQMYNLFFFVDSPYDGLEGKEIDPICRTIYCDTNYSLDEIGREVQYNVAPFSDKYLRRFDSLQTEPRACHREQIVNNCVNFLYYKKGIKTMNIYEWMDQNITVDKRSLFGCINVSGNLEQNDFSSRDLHIIELVKEVLTMREKVEISGAYFLPWYEFDGEKSFGPDDLSEDDYELLKELDYDAMPFTVRAKLSDLIWVENKEYKFAQIAIDSYFELFQIWFSDDDWYMTIGIMDRILCISAQINDSAKRNIAFSILWSHLRRIDGNDNGFLSIRIIERCIDGRNGTPEELISILEKIIVNHKKDVNKVKNAYLLKKKCFEWEKDNESAKKACWDLAKYYADAADAIELKTFQAVIIAENYLIEAINLYSNNGKRQEAELLHKKLIETQKKKPTFMSPVNVTYDVTELNNYMQESFEGLSFEEAIVRLTQFTLFKSYETIKKDVLDDIKMNPPMYLFGSGVINDTGQMVLNLPAIDISNPEKDLCLLDLYIHRKYYDIENMEGDLFLKRAMGIIATKYQFEEVDLDFLTNKNGIIPDGRERILRKAIYVGIKGDIYEALHILAPQVENIFRMIAKEAGALTVDLKNDSTSLEKVLGTVFSLPELKDCYDNDLLFIFEGLMVEQAGSNIRNDIAHGIMDEKRAYKGSSVFFLCAVIKLLSFYSEKFYDVYDKCEKLKELKDPGKRIVPTIVK